MSDTTNPPTDRAARLAEKNPTNRGCSRMLWHGWYCARKATRLSSKGDWFCGHHAPSGSTKPVLIEQEGR